MEDDDDDNVHGKGGGRAGEKIQQWGGVTCRQQKTMDRNEMKHGLWDRTDRSEQRHDTRWFARTYWKQSYVVKQNDGWKGVFRDAMGRRWVGVNKNITHQLQETEYMSTVRIYL